jgi:hypothetical protein
MFLTWFLPTARSEPILLKVPKRISHLIFFATSLDIKFQSWNDPLQTTVLLLRYANVDVEEG